MVILWHLPATLIANCAKRVSKGQLFSKELPGDNVLEHHCFYTFWEAKWASVEWLQASMLNWIASQKNHIAVICMILWPASVCHLLCAIIHPNQREIVVPSTHTQTHHRHSGLNLATREQKIGLINSLRLPLGRASNTLTHYKKQRKKKKSRPWVDNVVFAEHQKVAHFCEGESLLLMCF